MSDGLVRQRVGIAAWPHGWRVVVKIGTGSVEHDALYPSAGVAQCAAEAEALRLRGVWSRLGVRILVTTWVHEGLRGVAA